MVISNNQVNLELLREYQNNINSSIGHLESWFQNLIKLIVKTFGPDSPESKKFHDLYTRYHNFYETFVVRDDNWYQSYLRYFAEASIEIRETVNEFAKKVEKESKKA